jgi:hypothetical protein
MTDLVSARNAYYATKRYSAAVYEANADAALMHDGYRTPETERVADAADAAAFSATVSLKDAKQNLKNAKSLARKGHMETEYTLHYEYLGEGVLPLDLERFYDAFKDAADDDPRVKRYGRDKIKDRAGEVVAYRIHVDGTVSAEDFVNEVYDLKHGNW